MTPNPLTRVCLMPVLLLTAAVPAHAQQAPPAGTGGAPRAWFGGGAGSVGQTLTGDIAVGGGTFRREPNPAVNPFAPAEESSVSYLSGNLTYRLDAGRGNLSASYRGYGNYYAALSDDILVGHSGNVGGSYRFSSRTTLNGNQGVYYAPPIAASLQGIFGPGTGGDLPTGIDAGAIEDRSLSSYSNVGLRQEVTSHSDLSLNYSHVRTDFRSGQESENQLQVTDDASIRYNQRIGSYLRAWAGYRYGTSRVGDIPDAPRTVRSGWDVGLNLSRDFAVELTESTTLSFGGGGTVARSSANNTRFVATGNVRLNQQIRRSGNASIYYRRSADFVQGITDIVISDNVGADIRGSLSRRVTLNAYVNYARGDVGLEDRNSFKALSAGGGASIGIAREVGASVTYSHYRSLFTSEDFLLSPGLSNYSNHAVSTALGWRYLSFGVVYSRYFYVDRNNQALTAYVSLFAPLINRSRGSNATR